MSGPQFTQPQSTGLSCLGAVLESYHKLQLKPKTVPEFKNALQLIWSTLPEKAIDKAVNNYLKRLQACVSAKGGHFEHLM